MDFRTPIASALLCLTITGCDQKPLTASVASTATVPNADQTTKANYELTEKCAVDARAWYKVNYADPPEAVKVQSGGEISSTQPTYRNHYSHKLNGCYALLEGWTTFPPPHGQTLQTDSLWDVNENRQVGALVQKDLQKVTACNADGRECSSKAEFEHMARDYLVE
jgi:hypothetical protein